MDAIFKRRSIRKYTDQPVTDELVDLLLRAAMAAPSAGNQQPWHFIVIRDKAKMEEITKIHPSKMLTDAQLGILVCGDLSLESHKGYWVQDCSAATQNILLMAQDKGLGAVWCGVYPREDRIQAIKAMYNLPDNVIPFSLIPIGYPAEEKGPADRYNTERVHYDVW